MRQFQKFPELLLPMPRNKLVPPAAAYVNSHAMARHFSKQYFQAFRRWPSSQYMQTIAKQLNGRINMFKAMGRNTTWYVPAVMGLYSVYDAAPQVRMQTLFEEGFGIVGGALGTSFGTTWMASGVVGLISFFGLCLGPLGLFITVFICATGGGIFGYNLLKYLGGGAYDYGVQSNYQIYHTPDQLFEGVR